MQPLSATSALDPALARVRRLLTLRRSWQTALKLTFMAMVAEIGAGFNLNFNFGNHGQQGAHMPHALAIGFAMGYAVVIAILLLIGLVLFYLGSRMQFVIFDLIVPQETFIAPSWRLFAGVTWRWIGIRILLLLAVAIVFSPLLVPMLIAFVHVAATPAAQAHPAVLFTMLLGYIGTILLVSFVWFIVFTAVRSFGLPAIVFENTSIGATLRRTLEPLRNDPGQSLLYLLLQVVIRFATLVGGYIALVVGGTICTIPPGIAAVVLYFLTHNHGAAGKVLMVAGFVVLGMVWFAGIMIASIYLFGAMELFLSAYSVYFLAGRYPPLGALLDAQQPQLTPQPVYAGFPSSQPLTQPSPPPGL